jgi:outer membrane protein
MYFPFNPVSEVNMRSTKLRLFYLIFFLGTLTCLPGQSLAVGLEAAVGGWYEQPSGQLSYEGSTVDDILDINDDLNYDDTAGLFGRLKIDMPIFVPNIYLYATQMSFDGTGSKDDPFDFGDVTIQPGTFESELKLNNLDFALYYPIPLLKTATLNKFNIDIGINLRIYDVEARIQQETTGLRESVSELVPVPMLYLAAQLNPIDWLHLEGEGRGVLFSDNEVYSLIGRLRFDIYGPLFASGGYRFDKIKIDEQDVLVDTDFSGPFLELGLSF